MANKSINFDEVFEKLTGNKPLSWQRRLYNQWIEDDVKPIIDLPTGLGKTMVIPIWLIAQASNRKLGRRLIYVVDRRTVVDQATQLAEQLAVRPCIRFIHDSLGNPPAISTLRGQFADNREWTRDPSHPAIIIGTVDMIGSRLLFSGYACSSSQRSIHAGLIGHDSLVVLDEAHLSSAFGALLDQAHSAQTGEAERLQRPMIREPRPMRVVAMSATPGTSDHIKQIFRLIDGDYDDPIVHRRINATKRLHIHHANDVRSELIARAKSFADHNQRVIVFVRGPEQAQKIADALRRVYPKSVETLTGTMRGKERDAQLKDEIKHSVFKRFLTSVDPDAAAGTCFLVATAAGEVGADFNADHLICDLTPIDSIIQRLGRVNRRGDGIAEVHLIASSKPENNPKPFELSSTATLALLTSIQAAEDGTRDVSPLALRRLSTTLDCLSPKPLQIPLTDFLLDAWSMTSIRAALPGRPMVDPWLHGVDENETPRTSVAWRIELDHLGESVEPFMKSLDDYPLKPHELLSDRSDVVGKALAAIPPEQYEQVALLIGATVEVRTLGRLAIRNKDALVRELRDKTLVLPASIGGISGGMLAGNWNRHPSHDVSADVADISGKRKREWVTTRSIPADVSVGAAHIDDLDDYVRKSTASLAMRFVGSAEVPIQNADDGPAEWFVYFAADVEGNRNWQNVKESLDSHVDGVVRRVRSITAALSFDTDLGEALQLAARYHDTGKARDLWQAYARRGTDDPLLGKSNRYLDWRVLCFDERDPQAVFRHEFASLVDATSNPKINIHRHRELILHLIASHHGHARPHFGNSIDPAPMGNADPNLIAADVPVRFASLQRQYGRWGLAWLEAMLRCADQQASANIPNTSMEVSRED